MKTKNTPTIHLELDPHTLGRRLAEARKVAGITQQEAADHLEMSRPTFLSIEKGTRSAKPHEIVALAGLYRRSVHELVRVSQDTPPLEPHLRAAIGTEASVEIEAAIQALQDFANDYKYLEDLLGAKAFRDFPPEVSIPDRVDVRAFAEDIAIRERNRLHLGDQPVFALRSLVEEAGVHVFMGNIPSTLAGLYAFVPELGYCILINRKHPPERRRWTLAHEYAHFLADRHKPGVDYVRSPRRKPLSERFADAFAASFLMPETAIRRHFLAITERTGDFVTADLCRLAHQFFVSVQATAWRLEDLGLLPKGTWEVLAERGFKPAATRSLLGLEPRSFKEEPVPERYRYLAVQAYLKEEISEGRLAKLLRTDRVSAREIVEATLTSRDLDQDGKEHMVQVPSKLSLFDLAS